MTPVANKLNVWVFGPGTGEFIVVHVPPAGWLAIDGCAAAGVKYPKAFFDQLRAAPTHILLTHPHLDHAKGLVELIDHATRGARATWPKLGVLEPPRQRVSRRDTQAVYDAQVAMQVLNAMKTRWKRSGACRWEPKVGSTEAIGNGLIRVLSPEPEALPRGRLRRLDWNRAATALEVVWEGHRVVLGSDLVESPGHGWTRVLERRPQIREHVCVKVAHHASLAAQHEPFLARRGAEHEALLIATPFASSGLPRFESGEGVAVLLGHASQLLLTGLPQHYGTQNSRPRRWKRSALARLKTPVASDDAVGGFPACYVHITMTQSGKLNVHGHGPGSVVVERG